MANKYDKSRLIYKMTQNAFQGLPTLKPRHFKATLKTLHFHVFSRLAALSIVRNEEQSDTLSYVLLLGLDALERASNPSTHGIVADPSPDRPQGQLDPISTHMARLAVIIKADHDAKKRFKLRMTLKNAKKEKARKNLFG